MLDIVDALAKDLSLALALPRIATIFPSHQILDDWWQGEFHHDLVIGGLEGLEQDATSAKTLVLACN